MFRQGCSSAAACYFCTQQSLSRCNILTLQPRLSASLFLSHASLWWVGVRHLMLIVCCRVFVRIFPNRHNLARTMRTRSILGYGCGPPARMFLDAVDVLSTQRRVPLCPWGRFCTSALSYLESCGGKSLHRFVGAFAGEACRRTQVNVIVALCEWSSGCFSLCCLCLNVFVQLSWDNFIMFHSTQVQIFMWDYGDPCQTFPTLFLDLVVDSYFLVLQKCEKLCLNTSCQFLRV